MVSDELLIAAGLLIWSYGMLMYLGSSSRSGAAFQLVAGVVAIATALEAYTITADVVLTGVVLVVAVATFVYAYKNFDTSGSSDL